MITREDAQRLTALGGIWIMQSGMNASELHEMAVLATFVGTQLTDESDAKLRGNGKELVRLGETLSGESTDVEAIDKLSRLAQVVGEILTQRNE